MNGSSMDLTRRSTAARCPVKFFPSSGVLIGRAIQTVDVTYTPFIPEAEIFTLINLSSGAFHQQDILIESVGASCQILIEPTCLDFGILRVGTTQFKNVRISNVGSLSCEFYIESLDHRFHSEREQGSLDAGQEVDLKVSYTPNTEKKVTSFIKLHTFSPILSSPMDIKVIGVGGYPKLVITTQVIDFGTALFKSINKRKIEVHNAGKAPALLVYDCRHPDITIRAEDSESMEIAPEETKTLQIFYYPQVVENLVSKVFFRSSDNRGETFGLHLKGVVGIPKLSIEPSDAFENMDFGVMRLKSTYTKTFTLINDGTIVLEYSVQIEAIALRTIDEDENGAKQVSNVMNPIQATPNTGRLAVGESMEIKVSFSPTMLLDFTYEMKISCEFQSFTSIIRGVGGRSLPKIISPFENFEFELCRLGRKYQKTIQIYNYGNLGFDYKLRPIAAGQASEDVTMDSDNESTQGEWISQLNSVGMHILKPNGYCEPKSRLDLEITFQPLLEAAVKQDFVLLYNGNNFIKFTVSGLASTARLFLRDPETKLKIDENKTDAEIDIGIHPVNESFQYYIDLVNSGPFGIEYLVQPIAAAEFDAFPLRGYIDSQSSARIQINFTPSSQSRFHTKLRVIWEGTTIETRITAVGGIGRLEVQYLHERDQLLKTLDFGMVPFNIQSKKRFYLTNTGMVPVRASLEIENEDFAISMAGKSISISEIKNIQPSKETLLAWVVKGSTILQAGSAILMSVRFIPRYSTASIGNISINSDCGNYSVPLKGKGGTVTLSHRGDLSLGDMSCNYVYNRKITLSNKGSIPANLKAAFLVVGQPIEKPMSFVDLGESYGPLDPRSQYARKLFCIQRKADFKDRLSAKDRWYLLAIIVKTSLGTSASGLAVGTEILELPATRVNNAGEDAFSRMRKSFYHLITSLPISSQANPKVNPFIRVTPSDVTIPSYGEVNFDVEIMVEKEETFLATLIIKSDVPASPSYEIPLQATPKLFCIYCEDTRMLNFYKQPMGETEIISRKFSNLGHKDAQFQMRNDNSSLSVYPSKGVLKVGESVVIYFAFTPVDESVQTSDVLFEPVDSDAIRLKMCGGGGYAKASLCRYRRFDFGHCMIGKETLSSLPIINEGNAMLHLCKFQLSESDTFFKGKDWPIGRISLHPGKSYSLPLLFCPHVESPEPGSLKVATSSETFDIELVGLGREAVLIVSKVTIDFSECLTGNAYEQRLGLKNIGDVNYPVTFSLGTDFPDITVSPSTMTINPFTEKFVTIKYSPTAEARECVVLLLSSPYSSHKVPINVHAGFASVEFGCPLIDFGLFEKTSKASVMVTMINNGTVKTSFFIRDAAKPSIFVIEPQKGVLHPKKPIEIKVTHIKHEVANFAEKLIVKTDLVDKIYSIQVVGNCEETILHEAEFTIVNMGVCPVLEPSTKPVNITNYGRFPLKYQIQSAYPLKVYPTEGTVGGLESGAINLVWSPSGAYELRAQLLLTTNIGKFPMIVRGKSMFPEIAVSTTVLDFGICAVGYTYSSNFTIENKGKVKLHYSIPPCKESSFLTTATSGSLEPKDEKVIEVILTPKAQGKITSRIVVDCKGIHYKEILTVAMVGIWDVALVPSFFSLDGCPFDLKTSESMVIQNKGDVPIRADFADTPIQQGDCLLDLPAAITVPANQSRTIFIGFTVRTVDRFYAKITMRTKEEEFIIPVTGFGVRIKLSKRCEAIFQGEKHELCDPFFIEPEYLPVEYAINRILDLHSKSVLFYETLSILFSETREEILKPAQENMVLERRKSSIQSSMLAAINSHKAIESSQLQPTITEAQSSLSLANFSDVLPPIQPQTLVKDVKDVPSGQVEVEQPPLERFEKLYEKDADNDFSGTIEPERNIEAKIQVESSTESQQGKSDQDFIKKIVSIEEKRKLGSESIQDIQVPQVRKADQDIVASPGQTKLGVSDPYTSICNLLEKLQESDVQWEISSLNQLADQFLDVKLRSYSGDELIEDPIIYSVIHHCDLVFRDTNLDDVLLDPQTKFDNVDLSFVTCRPPPFKKENEKFISNGKSSLSRRSYMAQFPKLNRKERNANTTPF